mmetsp:Transcript_91344/g.289580  ORF Transcript_91344/g.289580 Transcript_91344/m.289580 type:complete len:329 (+) Transcript_91344:3-989(+)
MPAVENECADASHDLVRMLCRSSFPGSARRRGQPLPSLLSRHPRRRVRGLAGESIEKNLVLKLVPVPAEPVPGDDAFRDEGPGVVNVLQHAHGPLQLQYHRAPVLLGRGCSLAARDLGGLVLLKQPHQLPFQLPQVIAGACTRRSLAVGHRRVLRRLRPPLRSSGRLERLRGGRRRPRGGRPDGDALQLGPAVLLRLPRRLQRPPLPLPLSSCLGRRLAGCQPRGTLRSLNCCHASNRPGGDHPGLHSAARLRLQGRRPRDLWRPRAPLPPGQHLAVPWGLGLCAANSQPGASLLHHLPSCVARLLLHRPPPALRPRRSPGRRSGGCP